MALRWSALALRTLRSRSVCYARQRQLFPTFRCNIRNFCLSVPKRSSRALENILKEDIVEDSSDPVVVEEPPGPTPIPCPGCGAELQSSDESGAGFIRKEKLASIQEEKEKSPVLLPSSIVCQRCYWLRHYGQAMNVEVSEAEYRACLSRLADQHALVLWLVDVTDFPVSLYTGLAGLIGKNNPVVLVGNKIDLLKDTPVELLRRTRECLLAGWKASGLDEQCNLKAVHVVSAETGQGVRQMVDDILTQWNNEGDIYLVGCANSGKSTLFNAILPLMCGIPLGSKQGATISRWPGTTLRLVSFPVFSLGKRKRLRNQVLKAFVRRVNEEYDLPGVAGSGAADSAQRQFSNLATDDDKPPVCCYAESELEDMFGSKATGRKKLTKQVHSNSDLHNIVKKKYGGLLEDDSHLDPSFSIKEAVIEKSVEQEAEPELKTKSESHEEDLPSDPFNDEGFLRELERDVNQKGKKQAFLHDSPGLLNPSQVSRLPHSRPCSRR